MTKKQFLNPIQRFIKTESLSGVLLFSSAILAIIISNLPIHDAYERIFQYKIGIISDDFKLVKPLILWINDGLMAIFFFLIGLEIKREMMLGELNSFRKASLPILAALGGMLVPLSLYLLINQNPETSHGWGVPMATDIAFTLAILTLLGKRVPLGLKIFLTAFAIIDDLGAVLVIALFYTSEINWMLILYAGILLSVLYALSYFKIHSKFLLLILGLIIWVLFLKSGIHPTIAGILIAFAVPVRQRINEFTYVERICEIGTKLTDATNTNTLPVLSKNQIEEIEQLEHLTEEVLPPLQQLEHRLHKWVAFLIMPIFALANAGVRFSSETSIDFPLVVSITLSLFLGKTIGVFLFSYLGIKMKIATLPQGTNLTLILGASILSGVGFTMSLFIANLAFFEQATYMNSAKIGIIAGSIISGIIGYILIRLSAKQQKGKQA